MHVYVCVWLYTYVHVYMLWMLSQKFDQSPSSSALQWYDICTRMNMNTSPSLGGYWRDRYNVK